MQIILTEEEYNALKKDADAGKEEKVKRVLIRTAAIDLANNCFNEGAKILPYGARPGEMCAPHFKIFVDRIGL